jgi:hypothetical protein
VVIVIVAEIEIHFFSFYQRCSSRIVASRRMQKDQEDMKLAPANTSSWMVLLLLDVDSLLSERRNNQQVLVQKRSGLLNQSECR